MTLQFCSYQLISCPGLPGRRLSYQQDEPIPPQCLSDVFTDRPWNEWRPPVPRRSVQTDRRVDAQCQRIIQIKNPRQTTSLQPNPTGLGTPTVSRLQHGRTTSSPDPDDHRHYRAGATRECARNPEPHQHRGRPRKPRSYRDKGPPAPGNLFTSQMPPSVAGLAPLILPRT
jgi:hypothetical protein